MVYRLNIGFFRFISWKSSSLFLVLLITILVFNSFSLALPIHPLYQTVDLDELFNKARDLAFQGHRKEAREICIKILKIKPEYHDARILLGRLYAWDKEYDNARNELHRVIQDRPGHLDARNALIDVEFWSNRLPQALEHCEKGLKIDPDNKDFIFKKARIYEKKEDYMAASESLRLLLKIDPGHLDARQLLERIQHTHKLFEMSLRYRYDHFEREERSYGPWHLLSFDLSSKMKWGSIIARANYASRNFGSSPKSGSQFELDLYPRITKGFYAYLNGGYSSSSIFPKYRLGGELYKSLPFSFEISAGIRYLNFSGTQVYIYTGYLGKYYKNYWFSFRPFFTSKPSGVSFSGILIVRRYLEDAENYISLLLGFGSTPVELNFLEDIERYNSFKIGLEIRRMISKSTVSELELRFEREEFTFGKFGNRYTLIFKIQQIFYKKY